MEQKKVNHIELSDDEIKQAVGGKDYESAAIECMRAKGMTEARITRVRRLIGPVYATIDTFFCSTMSGACSHDQMTWYIYQGCVRSVYPRCNITRQKRY